MKKVKLLAGCFTAVIGIALLILMLFLHKNYTNFFKTAHCTTGVISEIEHTSKKTGSKRKVKHSYTVYVDYVADTESYHDVILGYHSSSMREGDSIVLYYDPENPTDIHVHQEHVFSIIATGGFAFVFFGISGIFFVLFMLNFRLAKLKETGIPIPCIIKEIAVNENYKLNGRPANYLICENTDPSLSPCITFQSGSSFAKDLATKHPIGSTITVYIDPTNAKRYYIEID